MLLASCYSHGEARYMFFLHLQRVWAGGNQNSGLFDVTYSAHTVAHTHGMSPLGWLLFQLAVTGLAGFPNEQACQERFDYVIKTPTVITAPAAVCRVVGVLSTTLRSIMQQNTGITTHSLIREFPVRGMPLGARGASRNSANIMPRPCPLQRKQP